MVRSSTARAGLVQRARIVLLASEGVGNGVSLGPRGLLEHVGTWTVDESTYTPVSQHHSETIFTIGNGYLGSRGTFEEGHPEERRTTFLHGVFDSVAGAIAEIANVPDWTAVQVLLDGDQFRMDSGSVEDYRRTLDLRTGELTRSLRWVAPSGSEARLDFRRFASLADEHLAVVTVRVTPEQDSVVEIRVPVFSSAWNLSDETNRIPYTEHLANLVGDDVVGAHVATVDRRYEVALAARVTAVGPAAASELSELPGALARTVRFQAEAGRTVGVDKVAAYETSRDGGTGHDVAAAALARARAAAGVDALAGANTARWAEDWAECDVEIDGDDDAQLAVRFNIFHLLVVGPRNDDQVNIGAKTLSGSGYHGHAFWDSEIFMLPLFTHTLPGVARHPLDYRWHRLPQARAKAASNGLEGAQFPWESADTGEEVTPTWLPRWDDPSALRRVWTGDIEIHISADIAYGAMQYWRATGDDDWFAAHGAELVLDTAKYYAARAEPDADGTFHYRDVIGPDEYHEHVDDNAFTNAMARWNIRTAFDVLDWLQEHNPARAADLADALDLTPDRLGIWREVVDGIVVDVQPDGRIPQFRGFFDLIDVDLDEYEPRNKSMHEVLGLEGASEHQAIKQPDVLMMTLLLENEFTEEQKRANYDYYTPRTDHVYGSSLGPSMQAIIAARAGLAGDAFEHFTRAALADLRDVRGNANDGIHGASCGGVWQAVVFGFGGLKIEDDGSWSTHPALPTHWDRLAFNFTLRGERHRVQVTR